MTGQPNPNKNLQLDSNTNGSKNGGRYVIVLYRTLFYFLLFQLLAEPTLPQPRPGDLQLRLQPPSQPPDPRHDLHPGLPAELPPQFRRCHNAKLCTSSRLRLMGSCPSKKVTRSGWRRNWMKTGLREKSEAKLACSRQHMLKLQFRFHNLIHTLGWRSESLNHVL